MLHYVMVFRYNALPAKAEWPVGRSFGRSRTLRSLVAPKQLTADHRSLSIKKKNISCNKSHGA